MSVPCVQPPQLSTPRPPSSLRLRTVLGLLVVVALVPALITSVFAIWQSALAYRHSSATRLADTAKTLVYSIENDLSARASFLQTLAIGIGSGGVTLDQASAWLGSLGAASGQLVLSVAEQGAGGGALTLQRTDLPAAPLLETLRTGRVSLSNLFRRAGQEQPEIAMSVRLPNSGSQNTVLSLVLPANELLHLAPQQHGSDDSLLVAVTDGTGLLLARTRDAHRFIGRPVPSWDKLKALGTRRGQFHAVTAEGAGVILSFETLNETPDWVVVVGEPSATFDKGWQQPLAQLAGGAALAMLLAWLVVAWLARTIVRPVRDLADKAQAVAAAQGEALPPVDATRAPALVINEFESMRVSIEEAQLALQSRADAERRNAQALATNELRFRTLARTGAVVLWRGTPEGRLSSADGWEILTGEQDTAALGAGWRRRVHADDQAAINATVLAIVRGAQQLDVEFRIARRDGSWCWVRGRGAAVPAVDGAVREWVGVLEDVSERHQAQARITHMALHDALTDLPNRVAFRNQLDAAIRRAGRGDASAVLYIDLDRFKSVNDTLGHPAGDALLRAVTERLKALVRENDSVARLAGDEFAIVQSHVNSNADSEELAQRLVEALGQPYDIQGHHVSIGASVGIMPITDGSHDADHLLKYADMALYRAKQQGRGRHRFFEPEMATHLQGRQRDELELHEALERNHFELSYAPMINTLERRVCGVSATLRWQHPERGWLDAYDFAPLTRQAGLSGRLVEWMLNRVCRDLANWPDCPKVSLDVSAALAGHCAALCGWVETALQQSGLQADRLELEIDENMLLAHAEAASAVVQSLNDMGVQTSLARFGASASALGLLRRLPFYKLKIEPSLLHDPQTQAQGAAIVRAIVQMCDEMGLVLGADGVDTDAQLATFPQRPHLELQGAVFGNARAAADIAVACRALSEPA